jgi:Fe2+ or Zn2+ uptake regulation protein
MLATTREVVKDLGQRVRSHQVPTTGDGAGFTPLIDVVGDIGRALSRPEAHDFSNLLPEIAALREGLEEANDDHFGPVARSPKQALNTEKLSTAYAAGALWATSAIIDGVLGARRKQHSLSRGRASRAEVREAIVDVLKQVGCARPREVQDHLESTGASADPATVSRALNDLLQAGVVEPASLDTDADRRARYYALTEREPSITHEERLALRSWMQEAAQRSTSAEVERVVAEETSYAFG